MNVGNVSVRFWKIMQKEYANALMSVHWQSATEKIEKMVEMIEEYVCKMVFQVVLEGEM